MRKPLSAAVLLRQARANAHLSQSDVARRAQIAQSVVSAYESGRREPSLSTLDRLVAATGHHLVVELEPDPGVPPGLPNTPLGRRLRQRRKALVATAARFGGSLRASMRGVYRAQITAQRHPDDIKSFEEWRGAA